MKRILVVDGEPVLAEIISELLEDEGYVTAVASGGRSALVQPEADPPDLVILDVMMPDGDGRHVAQAMHARPDLRDIPIVMMSAGATFRSLDDRMTGFLRKPFDLEELLALVRDTIGPAA